MKKTTLSASLTSPKDDWATRFRALASAKDVAALLEVPYGHLAHILYRAPHKYQYKLFTIRKRTGGVRTISAPHPTVKILQRKLNSILSQVYKPRSSTHGFTTGRSILTNAKGHSSRRFVLNIDLEDFFHTIHFGRIRGMFMAPPYNLPGTAATVLAQLCCHNKALAQGAPTSPIISNMVCSRLDGELQRLAKNRRCTYTRYADDITFSSNQVVFPVELASIAVTSGKRHTAIGAELASIISSNGFSINQKKARLQLRTERQHVTGLIVNHHPNTHRKNLSQLRAMLHAWHKYGLTKASTVFAKKWDHRNRRPDSIAPRFQMVIKGKLDFVGMVKTKSNRRYRLLRNALHALDPKLISKLPEPHVAPTKATWEALFQKYKNCIYQLEIITEAGDIAGGTVFAWESEWLATAAHNLGSDLKIYSNNPSDSPISTLAAIPHQEAASGTGIDAALLRMPPDALKHKEFIPLRTTPVTPGEEVAALGFPRIPFHKSSLSIMIGKVESIAPKYDGTSETIQVSIDFSGGVSGGPVIDQYGHLVGIVSEASVEKATADVPGKKFRNVVPAVHLKNIILPKTDPGF